MWEKVKLGDCFQIIRNGANIKQTDSAGGIPITRIETISKGLIDEKRLGYADIEEGKFAEYYLQKEDILMSHINSLKHLGKTALVDVLSQNIIHGMNLLMLRPNDRCHSQFVKFYFETNVFYNQVLRIANQSVNQSSFTVAKLKDIEIPLPPLPIQEKIAAILDKADELRRKDQELQDKYDKLAQAIFIDMFGDPVRNEKGWEVNKIKDIASQSKYSIKAGPFGSALKKEYYVNEGFKIYGQEQVIADDLTIGDYYINEEKFNALKSCAVSAGDILISLVGTYGKISIVPNQFEPGIINPRLMKITLNESIYASHFFKFVMQTVEMKNYISTFSRGGTMDIVNLGIISNLNIIVPPLHLQEAFAKKIKLINELKAKANKEKSEELFQSLLQRAFKGELTSTSQLTE